MKKLFIRFVIWWLDQRIFFEEGFEEIDQRKIETYLKAKKAFLDVRDLNKPLPEPEPHLTEVPKKKGGVVININ